MHGTFLVCRESDWEIRILITCAEAARLTSDRMNRPVGCRARMALRFHLLLCSGCRQYGRQLALIGRWLRSGRLENAGNAERASTQLDDAAHSRIQAALEKGLKEEPDRL